MEMKYRVLRVQDEAIDSLEMAIKVGDLNLDTGDQRIRDEG